MKHTGPEVIKSALSDMECFYAYKKVQHAMNLWDKRDERVPWYTLGPAAYLDAKDGNFENYVKLCLSQRPFLLGYFHQEAELIKILLEHVLLKEPVEFHPTYAPFGFHIFGSSPAFLEDNVGSIHMDRQDELLEWFEPAEEKLSGTIPICLPLSGGGLNYWENDEKKYLPYNVGDLIYHFGNLKHQIASAQPPILDWDERITIQFHAVKERGVWWVYR